MAPPPTIDPRILLALGLAGTGCKWLTEDTTPCLNIAIPVDSGADSDSETDGAGIEMGACLNIAVSPCLEPLKEEPPPPTDDPPAEDTPKTKVPIKGPRVGPCLKIRMPDPDEEETPEPIDKKDDGARAPSDVEQDVLDRGVLPADVAELVRARREKA